MGLRKTDQSTIEAQAVASRGTDLCVLFQTQASGYRRDCTKAERQHGARG
jgi:hypothetical protein